MAYLGGTFDATQYEPGQDFEPLPAGIYTVMVTESDVGPTKAGTGQVLKLTFDVLDGPYKGRKLFDRINLQNASIKAQEIGQRQFADLCRAVGVIQVQDSQQLHNRPLQVRVKYVPPEGQYEAKNEVKAYKALPGGAPAAAPVQAPAPQAATPAPAAPVPAAPAGASSPPWARKAG